MTKIYWLVGPMGSGKNYVGKKLAKKLGCNFYDGDDSIPPLMAKKVSEFNPLTEEDLDSFVENHLIPDVEEMLQKSSLVVAQALYRKKHRNKIKKHFSNCCFIKIKAPLFLNLKRLWSRKNGLRWAIYGLLNLPFFQNEGIDQVINNGRKLNLDSFEI